MVNFTKIVDRIREIEKLGREKDVAAIFEISPPDFSKRKKSGTLLPFIINWGIAKKVNLNWLFTGKGEKYVMEASKPPESTIAKESMSEHGQSGKKLILDLLEDEDIKKALSELLGDVLQNIAAKSEDNETKLKKIEGIISNVCLPPEGIQERRRCRASIEKIL